LTSPAKEAAAYKQCRKIEREKKVVVSDSDKQEKK
jgi:hypothetical protein